MDMELQHEKKNMFAFSIRSRADLYGIATYANKEFGWTYKTMKKHIMCTRRIIQSF
jgi:hypothetical protein